MKNSQHLPDQIPKNDRLPQYKFMDEYGKIIGIRKLLRLFNMSPNAYYNYKKHRKTEYYRQKQRHLRVINEIFYKFGCIPGYRVMVVLLKKRGISLSGNTVLKYMRELGLRSIVNTGVKTDMFKNLLLRDFNADKPNLKWCTDFTLLYIADGSKRINCSILDLYDRSVVSTLNGSCMNSMLAMNTLMIALIKNPSASGQVILHSDRGSQFTSQSFIEYCRELQVTQSFSKRGSPHDNAPMESFYGTMKAELAHHCQFDSGADADAAVYSYAFEFYNTRRPHSSNGYLTPMEKRLSNCS